MSDPAANEGDPPRSHSEAHSEAISETIDLERNQLGHDLHDVLLPLVFAASANVQRCLLDASLEASHRRRLTQAAQWLSEAQIEGRNLLAQLHPPELERESWLPAAKRLTEKLCRDHCEVVWTISEESPVLNPDWNRDLAAAAFRILGEACRNAIRHGAANLVSVRCDRTTISIVDDGSGFDPQHLPQDRFGIRCMKQRAKLVGSNLNVTSEPGGPTKVTLTIGRSDG